MEREVWPLGPALPSIAVTIFVEEMSERDKVVSTNLSRAVKPVPGAVLRVPRLPEVKEVISTRS